MYICPMCNKSFENEEILRKHYLNCWKENHPFHIPKPAPSSKDIVDRQLNDDIANFFKSLKEKNDWSFNKDTFNSNRYSWRV